MKCLLLLTIGLFTSMSYAAAPESLGPVDTTTRWRFGVGLGLQSQMQNLSEIEVGTGELFHCRNQGLSLILSYMGSDTILEDVKNEHYTNHNYKLMLESKLHGSNQNALVYVRLGVGYTDTEKLFHPDGGFIMMPIQIGMDTKILQTDTSYLAFYVQGGSDVNFLGDNTRAKNFDGVHLTVGFRGYY